MSYEQLLSHLHGLVGEVVALTVAPAGWRGGQFPTVATVRGVLGRAVDAPWGTGMVFEVADSQGFVVGTVLVDSEQLLNAGVGEHDGMPVASWVTRGVQCSLAGQPVKVEA